MAEGVVDLLEAVEVHQQQTHRPSPPSRGGERPVEAVGQQRAVGQTGQGIVQGLVGELVLDTLAFADITRDDDDALDVGVAEQVVGRGLHRHPRAVGVCHAELHGVDHAGAGHAFAQGSRHRVDVVGMHEVEHRWRAVPLRIAQDPRCGRARVPHAATAVEHGDDVARVLDDQAEAGLALAQRVLGHLAIGDVTLDRHQVGADVGLVGDGVDAVLHPEGGPVLAVVEELDGDRSPVLGGAPEGDLGVEVRLRAHEEARVVADDLVGPVAGLGREGGVDEHDPGLARCVVLGHDHGVAGVDHGRLQEPKTLVRGLAHLDRVWAGTLRTQWPDWPSDPSRMALDDDTP